MNPYESPMERSRIGSLWWPAFWWSFTFWLTLLLGAVPYMVACIYWDYGIHEPTMNRYLAVCIVGLYLTAVPLEVLAIKSTMRQREAMKSNN